jgi:hypothetical protein
MPLYGPHYLLSMAEFFAIQAFSQYHPLPHDQNGGLRLKCGVPTKITATNRQQL